MKVLNKLTLKNLRLNKTRTIVTIIGILLSTALITVVAGMATSAQRTMLTTEIAWNGDFDVALKGVKSEENLNDIKANRNVKTVYLKEELGCALLPEAKNENHPYLDIKSLDKAAFTDCFQLSLSEGHFPNNSSEIVLSENAIARSNKKFKIGDKITLDVGTRTDGRGNIIGTVFEYGWSPEEWNSDVDEPIQEKLTDTQSKTYTIVGFLNKCSNSTVCSSSYSACSTALTLADGNFNSALTAERVAFIDYLPEAEKDYLKVTAQITGLTEEDVETAAYDVMSEDLRQKSGYSAISINTSVLRLKGYALGDGTVSMLYSLAVIIIAIVILASVFVIRNSFAISITEKTKLYGMLASVGTTAKQIKRNVLFEGFCLGIIGIPLGIILGLGVVQLLIIILNLLLGSALNGACFEFGVPVLAIIIAAALAAVTILFSTLSTAVRASKVAPITAIRGNKDIKTNKKKKTFTAPRFVNKLFGTGGVVAYKNLKRSKKKYRTTVVSIVISVMLFVAISSFMDYGMAFTDEYYGGYNHNVIVNSYFLDSNGLEEWKKQSAAIAKLDGIKDITTLLRNDGVSLVNSYEISEEGSDGGSDYLNKSDHFHKNEKGETLFDVSVIALDDYTYNQVLTELSAEPDKDAIAGKAIFLNRFTYRGDDGKTHVSKLLDINSQCDFEYYYRINGEPKHGDEKIKVFLSTTEMPPSLEDAISPDTCCLLVNRQWFENKLSNDNTNGSILINAENAGELEQNIFGLGYTNLDVSNIDEIARQYNSMMIIMGIFIYGFIAVITLIGITNIFNTISTNMRLRSNEFAMLKSIGMTKKEFNRMIRLESLFYGVKSLLIGIPLGILGGIGIFFAFGQGNVLMTFVIPWKAIIISIVFVFAVVWMIMKYSVSKVNKQNIIETIRNDNI